MESSTLTAMDILSKKMCPPSSSPEIVPFVVEKKVVAPLPRL